MATTPKKPAAKATPKPATAPVPKFAYESNPNMVATMPTGLKSLFETHPITGKIESTRGNIPHKTPEPIGASAKILAASKPTVIAPVKKTGRSSFMDIAEDVVPYMSNLRNAFQKPPLPPTPDLVSPVTLKGVNLDKARADVRSEARAAEIGISDRLRGNVAEAYKASTLGTKMRALSDISDREAQANASIANQQAQLNLGVEGQNVGTMNQYRQQLTERSIVDQAQKSANIANAADKFMAQQASKRADELEKTKFGLYSKMFAPGVSQRLLTGAGTELGLTQAELEKKAGFRKYGGKMRPIC